MRNTILILLLISFCSKVNAEDVFPISTEMQIGKIRNLVDKAPNGIYLTVGGERAFRGASMFKGIEHLIIFDISPIIIKYNKINIELLKAPNKEIYKQLRWESDFPEWTKISEALTEDDFKWWNETIRNIKGYDLPESLNRNGSYNKYIKLRQKLLSIYPVLSAKFNNREHEFLSFVTWSDIENHQKNLEEPLTKKEFEWFDSEKKYPGSCIQKFIDDPSKAVDWGQVIDYKSGNYLFDDELYARLHGLVLENKVTIVNADMTKQKDIDSVTKIIQQLGLSLGVLDLNNLYLYNYMGEEKFRTALAKLLSFGNDNSILILMHNYKDYPCAQFSIYVGATFEHIKSWPNGPFFDAFINSIPADMQPLFDGHLYEGKDELPLYLMKK